MLLHDPDLAIETLARLRALGVHIEGFLFGRAVSADEAARVWAALPRGEREELASRRL